MARFVLFVCAVVVLLLFADQNGGKIEGYFAPIVTDVEFEIEAFDGDTSIINGSFVLHRSAGCNFIGVEWYFQGANRLVFVESEFREPSRERFDGPNDFGPWWVDLPPDVLRNQGYAVALHDCHPLWQTESRFY